MWIILISEIEDLSNNSQKSPLLQSGLNNLLQSKSILYKLAEMYLNISRNEAKNLVDNLVSSNDCIDDNGAVHIISQIATDYDNVSKAKKIYFDGDDYNNYYSPISNGIKTPYLSMCGNNKVIGEICSWFTTNQFVLIQRDEGWFLEKYYVNMDTTMVIPRSLGGVDIIGLSSSFAFDNNVETIIIPDSICFIDKYAFSGFDSLQQIIVEDQNLRFSSSNGVLYNKNFGELIHYPKNRNQLTYTVKNETITIKEGAFKGVNFLDTIDLNNVNYLEDFAFLDSQIINVVSHNQISYIGKEVFHNTPYFTNSANVIIDQILIKYTQGEFPTDIRIIAQNAVNDLVLGDLVFTNNMIISSFAFNNCNIDRIMFESEENTLAEFSFNNCTISNGVVFTSINEPNVDIWSIYTNETIEIFVAVPICNSLKEKLKDNESYLVDSLKVDVIFNPNNGETLIFTQYEYYGYLVDCPNVTRNGYIFFGWEDQNGTVYNDNSLLTSFSSINLSAKWEEEVYNISYDLEGGCFDKDENVVNNYTINSSNIVLPVPKKEGYNFIGWETRNMIISEIVGGSIGNYNLKAIWEAVEYTISLELGTSDITFDQKEIKVIFGQPFVINDMPNRVGYKFLGWYDNLLDGIMIANESGEGYLNRSDIVTLFAIWQIETYELEINYGNNKFVWVINDTNISSEPEAIEKGSIINFINLIDTFKRSEYGYMEGYKFIKFELATGEDIQSIYGTSIAVDDLSSGNRVIIINAIWEKETHKFIFNTQVFGKSCPDIIREFGEEYQLPSIEELTSKGIVKEGHSFGGWYTYIVDNNGNIQLQQEFINGLMPDLTVPFDITNPIDRYYAQMDGSVALIANWIPINYTISFDSDGGSLVNDITVTYGQLVGEMPTTSKTGYIFQVWQYGGMAIDSETQYIYSQDIEVKAIWEIITYSISYDRTSFETVDNLYDKYTVEDTIELGKAYKLGYSFIGWRDENGDIIETIHETIGHKMLTAVWSGTEVYASSSGTQYSISNPYTIINVANNCTFSIKNTTKQVMFYSVLSSMKVKIVVESRSSELSIIFKNINLTSNINTTLLDASNASKIKVVTVGTVNLFAGNIDKEINTAAIKCKAVDFYGDGYLTLKGANNIGYNGLNGYAGAPALIVSGVINIAMRDLSVYGGSGSSGLKPVQAADMISIPPKQTAAGKPGIQGYTGNTGLTGGTGGSGAVTIKGVTSIKLQNTIFDKYLRSSTIKSNAKFYGGHGGNGGEGGKGGKGGRGGEGRDGTLFVYGTSGGKGGTGGTGGNGGAFGKGADAVENNIVVQGCQYVKGFDGMLGYKGEGGEGGLGGVTMVKGNRYPSGAKGDKGEEGKIGTSR